jgi:hypothetical protein
MPLEKDWLAPGDSMEVEIHWSLKRHVGSVSRLPRVFSNATGSPHSLVLKGSVSPRPDSIRPVTAKPFRLLFGKTSAADIDSIAVELTNHTSEQVAVEVVSPTNPELVLNLPATIEPFSSATGYARLTEGFGDKEFQTSVTLLFSDERTSRLTLPVERKFYLATGK